MFDALDDTVVALIIGLVAGLVVGGSEASSPAGRLAVATGLSSFPPALVGFLAWHYAG
jgi:hypothetical protein